MGSSAHDVLQSLGDALAGVNRNTEFMKGEELGATVDEKRAQTDAAMANARHQRAEAEVTEALKLRQDRIAAAKAAELTNPDSDLIGTVIASGHGADLNAVQESRLRGQEYNLRGTIATPPTAAPPPGAAPDAGSTPIGSVFEAQRQAAEDALAPAAAVSGRSDRGAPVVATDKDGNPIYVTPKQATTQHMTPGAKPAVTQPSTGEKDYKFLRSIGVTDLDAQQLAYHVPPDKDTPDQLYNSVLEALMHNPLTSDPDDAAKKARSAVASKFGDTAAATVGNKPPRGAPKPAADSSIPADLPPGSKAVSQTRDGKIIYELPNGKRVTEE